MEKRKSAHRDREGKKTPICVGDGAGIGGLVVWGGALAVASLVAAFTIKRVSRRDPNQKPTLPNDVSKDLENKCSEKEKEGSGELQLTVHHNRGRMEHELSKVSGAQVDCCELVPTQSLMVVIPGEKSQPTGFENKNFTSSDQETVPIFDVSKQETFALCKDYYFTKQSLASEPGNFISNNRAGDLPLAGITEGKKEEEALETKQKEVEENSSDDGKEDLPLVGTEVTKEDAAANAEQKYIEENTQTNLVGEEEGDYHNHDPDGSSEYTIEDVEESSEDFVKNDNGEELPLVETIEDAEQITTEENSPTYSVDIEEGVHDDDGIGSNEYTNENVEMSSAGLVLVKDNHGEDFSLVQTIEVNKKDEAVDAEEEAIEENTQLHSAEVVEVEDYHDDASEEYCIENRQDGSEYLIRTDHEGDLPVVEAILVRKEEGDESSEGRDSSSAESNVEVVWPAESIEALSMVIKNVGKHQKPGKIDDNERTREEEDGDSLGSNNGDNLNYGTDSSETTGSSTTLLNKEETLEVVMANNQIAHTSKWRFRVWSILLLILLMLLLLTQVDAFSCYLLRGDSFIVHEF